MVPHHVPNRNQNQQQAQQELPNPRPTMRSALVSCCSSVHGFVVLLQITSLLRFLFAFHCCTRVQVMPTKRREYTYIRYTNGYGIGAYHAL